MTHAHGYAAHAPGAELRPFGFERRTPGPGDVVLDILFCGICHSDLSYIDEAWGPSHFPLVPGHEIIGRVKAVGANVTGLAPGDLAGIGCIIDACMVCEACAAHEENMCAEFPTPTYNGFERVDGRPTYGGYSNNYVARAEFVLKLPQGMDPAGAAPLLCAGITTYSPLRQAGAGPGMRVGVVGLGGLGHMAIKLAYAMGASVTLITTSPSKRDDALALGASDVIVSTDPAAMASHAGSLDYILDTVSAEHDVAALLQLLRRKGTLCLVGLPAKPLQIPAMSLVIGNRRLIGSPIGGIAETQEMLDFCGAHAITADVEVVPLAQVNTALARLRRNDVKYRFVLDVAGSG